MNRQNKEILILVSIIIVVILIIFAMAKAGGSDLYRLLRLSGYSESDVEYYMSLPQIQSLEFDEGKVEIEESCLLISINFHKVYHFSIDYNSANENTSCKIVIEKLIDLDAKKSKK